jgi:hypothetical protein
MNDCSTSRLLALGRDPSLTSLYKRWSAAHLKHPPVKKICRFTGCRLPNVSAGVGRGVGSIVALAGIGANVGRGVGGIVSLAGIGANVTGTGAADVGAGSVGFVEGVSVAVGTGDAVGTDEGTGDAVGTGVAVGADDSVGTAVGAGDSVGTAVSVGAVLGESTCSCLSRLAMAISSVWSCSST